MRSHVPWLALALLAVASCAEAPRSATTSPLTVPAASEPTTSSRPPITTVAVIGDSITVGAEDEVREALGDLGLAVVAIDAQSGRRMTTASDVVDAGTDAARRVRRLDPDLWVVALGTNDVFSVGDGADATEFVDGMLAAIPPDVPLVWVDVFVEDAEDASRAINLVVHERLGRRGNAVVTSWMEIAQDRDLLRDGVHPTEPGEVAFAGVVASGVSSWLG